MVVFITARRRSGFFILWPYMALAHRIDVGVPAWSTAWVHI